MLFAPFVCLNTFSHLLGKSCSLGLPYVLFVLVLNYNFGRFPLGFLVGIYVLIAPVPDHRLTLTFKFSKNCSSETSGTDFRQ